MQRKEEIQNPPVEPEPLPKKYRGSREKYYRNKEKIYPLLSIKSYSYGVF